MVLLKCKKIKSQTELAWILNEKMLENRPEDALGLLVETVETVKTV